MEDIHGNASDVYAISGFASEDLQLAKNGSMWEEIFGITLNSENLFYLQLFNNKDSRPWQLVLDNEAAQMHAKKYQGVFAIDDNRVLHACSYYKSTEKERSAKSTDGINWI